MTRATPAQARASAPVAAHPDHALLGDGGVLAAYVAGLLAAAAAIVAPSGVAIALVLRVAPA